MGGGTPDAWRIQRASVRAKKRLNGKTKEGPIGEPHSTGKCAKLRTTEKHKPDACTVNQRERSGNAQGT